MSTFNLNPIGLLLSNTGVDSHDLVYHSPCFPVRIQNSDTATPCGGSEGMIVSHRTAQEKPYPFYIILSFKQMHPSIINALETYTTK